MNKKPDRRQLFYGETPVPYAAAWSGEGRFSVDTCPHIGALAIIENEARGQGKPNFGKPHCSRQREVMVNELCDVCGKTLAGSTKVSLSHVRVVSAEAVAGPQIIQVEPLLHRACARQALTLCPSLRDQLQTGRIQIRQVFKYHLLIAQLTAAAVEEFTGQKPITDANGHCGIYGHAKIALDAWRDRDPAWIEKE